MVLVDTESGSSRRRLFFWAMQALDGYILQLAIYKLHELNNPSCMYISLTFLDRHWLNAALVP